MNIKIIIILLIILTLMYICGQYEQIDLNKNTEPFGSTVKMNDYVRGVSERMLFDKNVVAVPNNYSQVVTSSPTNSTKIQPSDQKEDIINQYCVPDCFPNCAGISAARDCKIFDQGFKKYYWDNGDKSYSNTFDNSSQNAVSINYFNCGNVGKGTPGCKLIYDNSKKKSYEELGFTCDIGNGTVPLLADPNGYLVCQKGSDGKCVQRKDKAECVAKLKLVPTNQSDLNQEFLSIANRYALFRIEKNNPDFTNNCYNNTFLFLNDIILELSGVEFYDKDGVKIPINIEDITLDSDSVGPNNTETYLITTNGGNINAYISRGGNSSKWIQFRFLLTNGLSKIIIYPARYNKNGNLQIPHESNNNTYYELTLPYVGTSTYTFTYPPYSTFECVGGCWGTVMYGFGYCMGSGGGALGGGFTTPCCYDKNEANKNLTLFVDKYGLMSTSNPNSVYDITNFQDAQNPLDKTKSPFLKCDKGKDGDVCVDLYNKLGLKTLGELGYTCDPFIGNGKIMGRLNSNEKYEFSSFDKNNPVNYKDQFDCETKLKMHPIAPTYNLECSNYNSVPNNVNPNLEPGLSSPFNLANLYTVNYNDSTAYRKDNDQQICKTAYEQKNLYDSTNPLVIKGNNLNKGILNQITDKAVLIDLLQKYQNNFPTDNTDYTTVSGISKGVEYVLNEYLKKSFCCNKDNFGINNASVRVGLDPNKQYDDNAKKYDFETKVIGLDPSVCSESLSQGSAQCNAFMEINCQNIFAQMTKQNVNIDTDIMNYAPECACYVPIQKSVLPFSTNIPPKCYNVNCTAGTKSYLDPNSRSLNCTTNICANVAVYNMDINAGAGNVNNVTKQNNKCTLELNKQSSGSSSTPGSTTTTNTGSGQSGSDSTQSDSDSSQQSQSSKIEDTTIISEAESKNMSSSNNKSGSNSDQDQTLIYVGIGSICLIIILLIFSIIMKRK